MTSTAFDYQKPYYQVQYAEIDVIEDNSPKELLKFLIPEDIAMHILESVDRSPPLPGVVYVDLDQFQMHMVHYSSFLDDVYILLVRIIIRLPIGCRLQSSRSRRR